MELVRKYHKTEAGEWILLEEIQVETNTEQLIADKEAQLLEMYQELQVLKEQTRNLNN